MRLVAGAAVLALATALPGAATRVFADTIESALVRSYQSNPQLNAQRASVRATDESVPQALSGYRPKVAITTSGGFQHNDFSVTQGLPSQGLVGNIQAQLKGDRTPVAYGATVSQTLFDGFQTANKTRAAEGQVSASREGLRVLEQTVLLAAATIYMDYLRDSAIVEVQRSNVRVLEETLKQTRDRFNVGEVTRTDVAQSEAQLAAGRTQLMAAESNLTTTRANYRRIVGNEPGQLAPGSPVDRFLPATLSAAVDLGLIQNPNVTAAMYGIDVSHLQVKVAEGALFPNVSLQANVQQSYNQQLTVPSQLIASAIAQVTVPIYQGGAEYSLIRQSKETLAQQRLTLELVRTQARASVVQAWGQLVATKLQVQSAQAQVEASEIAVNGIREEAKAGQRTTFDVLVAQQTLVTARVALVTAQHDRVVASYAVLNAVGRLSPQVLKLNTTVYDPSVHYHQVRDSWGGMRTPDGQ
ncbi:TolC family outer membrane protein [Nitrobacter vulgaris]|jgi:outer membrane protein|uniref:TolC family outer membrane protein n=1 Tax=Nitrobacter vulgaris TaxID=29421 RepID=UPI0035B53D09